MSQQITINDVQIEQILHCDMPVVTFQQIADVHGIDVDNVQKSFRRHRERFTEAKHYFRLDFTEVSSLGLGVPAKLHNESRYVDGAVRDVKWYPDKEAIWIDTLIQIYMSEQGFTLAPQGETP